MINSIVASVLGYGPIQPLLADPSVTEVMVNGPNQIFVERAGQLTLADAQFEDDAQLRRVINRIVSPIGRRIDESSPMVDARLPDGSRVNAIIPPLAVDGASLTIRKFSKKNFSAEDLVNMGSATVESIYLIAAAVRGRLNTLVSGGTGSGKTSLLNVLSSFIPEGERIVTIEDAVELRMGQEHVVRLEARPGNSEGRGLIEIRDLVRNALRMRPDRVIVGECRGGEALDMLQAMNTGHAGSLSTLHANSPDDATSRLETMVLMGGIELPIPAIRKQIESAVDLIVHTSRLRDGSRRIVEVSEVDGIEGNDIMVKPIFKFRQTGVDADGRLIGQLEPTGHRPGLRRPPQGRRTHHRRPAVRAPQDGGGGDLMRRLLSVLAIVAARARGRSIERRSHEVATTPPRSSRSTPRSTRTSRSILALPQSTGVDDQSLSLTEAGQEVPIRCDRSDSPG